NPFHPASPASQNFTVLISSFLCHSERSVCLPSKQDIIPLEMGLNPFHPASPASQNFTVLISSFPCHSERSE
ncbi:MAG: hypothetical protein IKI03_03595, partial [Clostridia bacterium]|nr:hypothetical protein [Clostridia bacterium]